MLAHAEKKSTGEARARFTSIAQDVWQPRWLSVLSCGSVCRSRVTVTARLASTHTALVSQSLVGSVVFPSDLSRSTSTGWRPSITSYIRTVSETLRAIGPAVSKVCDKGMIPSVGIWPSVVLRPVIPHQAAGPRTDPPVSVPTAQLTIPEATATADPLEEPPGVRWIWRSHGFHGVPIC